jgi:diacylglycerol kinase (ATP)
MLTANNYASPTSTPSSVICHPSSRLPTTNLQLSTIFVPMSMHIALVCNPSPGNEKALHLTQAIANLLSARNVACTIFIHPWPATFPDFTDVWIMGGDGTLNIFINQYPDLNLPLSVFPGGSGNDFHWMLYGDVTPDKQVDILLQANVRKIDAGICNGKLFLNGVGIGFDGAVVHDLLGKKKLAGKASYLLSILKQLIGFSEKEAKITAKEQHIEEGIFMISVANAKRYGGGFYVAPKAKMNDGLLDTCVIGRIAPLKRIKYLPVMEKGLHLSLPFVTYFQTARVEIEFTTPVYAHVDGEYFQDTTFRIQVLPERFSFRL